MKINDVEELLGISKANIRFYEKEKLLTPNRLNNGYREYSEEDIHRLQDILILRKLGVSVSDVRKIFVGELSLQDAMRNNITQLEEQIEILNGALQLSQQISKEELEHLDTQRYWRLIQEKERAGEKFMQVVTEFWNILQPPAKEKTRKESIYFILTFCLVFVVDKLFSWEKGGFIENFRYWFVIALIIVLMIISACVFGKRNPKAASWIVKAGICLCLGILALSIILTVIGVM